MIGTVNYQGSCWLDWNETRACSSKQANAPRGERDAGGNDYRASSETDHFRNSWEREKSLKAKRNQKDGEVNQRGWHPYAGMVRRSGNRRIISSRSFHRSPVYRNSIGKVESD